MMLGRVRPRYVINIADDRNSSATSAPGSQRCSRHKQDQSCPGYGAQPSRILWRLLVIPLDTIKIISIMYNGI